MRAVKGNKEYSIGTEQKQFYLDAGCDIVDEYGNILERGRGNMVRAEDYEKAMERIKELEVALSQVDSVETVPDRKDKKGEK